VFRSALVALVLVACSERPPPPGAGALETTPTAKSAHASQLTSTPASHTVPNGGVLVVEPGACRVRLLRDGTSSWEHELPRCNGFLEANVAMDSVSYVRDPRSLLRFEPDGWIKWTQKLADPPPPISIAAPTVLADSRAAIAATVKTVTVFEHDGTVSWSFSLPAGEELLAPPTGMKTEGLALVTTRAVYYLSAAGEVRWRSENGPHAGP
jgi:outer membrane protein assembly factor BamB